ncbi:MAG TPA: hypothetical protein VHA78_03105 [Candidatus Peribacteraceae bacterium]|nr:hypothetical protein [Candidatus Peribacteraceae bacterium]
MKIRFGSFGLGVASGLVVLALFSGVNHLIHPVSAQGAYARGGGFGQNGTPNLARLSQRLGISQDQLQKELQSGKTIQQIMQENGTTFGGGQRTGSGTNVGVSGSGTHPHGNGSPSSSSISSAS